MAYQSSLFDNKSKIKDSEMLVRTFLREGDTYSYSKLDMLKYAVTQGYIGEMDTVNLLDMNLGLPRKVVAEYKSQAEYDVILFNKGGKKRLCNEAITREDAVRICSSESSRGLNYFAGFAPTGSYPHAEKGEAFIIDGKDIINPKEG